MGELLKKVLDLESIRSRMWYVPIIVLMPAVALVAYLWMRLAGLPLLELRFQILAISILFVVFSISAACEEVGWMGYASGPLQERWSALDAGEALGSVWALWHVVPVTVLWGPKTLALCRFAAS